MKNRFFKAFLCALIGFGMNFPGYTGGLPSDNNEDELARELARTQNDLDREKSRGDDLERRIRDLESREPSQTVISSKEDGEFPVHGYFSASYADPDYLGANGTFHQETLNVFLKYPLSDKFLFFADVGFMHGSEISVDQAIVDGVGDLTVVEAWLDWKAADENMVFRFGKFRTPFGNWMPNEYPYTTHTVFDPLLVRWSIVPARTTGIQEYGTFDLGAIKLSQKFYIGNGKSYHPHSADANTDKALGSRIGVLIPFSSEKSGLDIGLNGYVGRDDRDGNDYQEKAWGIDAKLDISALTLRFETIKSRTNEDEFAPGEEGHVWRFAWFGMISFNFLEKFDVYYRHDMGDEEEMYGDSEDLDIDSIGLAYRPIEPVVFKIEYDRYRPEITDDYNVYSAQVAVKF